MKYSKLSLVGALLLCTLALTGCATAARTDAMVASSAVTPIATNASRKLLGNIAISDVTGGSSTNPLWVSKVGGAEFEKALEASLKSVGFLSENRQSGDYKLVADLREVKQPVIGLDMTVTSRVEYQLIERSTGNSVFRETIAAPYTAKMSDSFLGYERLRIANEGSIRANIERLIQKLAALVP